LQKIFKVKNTFNLSTNSFNPSVSCYFFAGAFVRPLESGWDRFLGIISHQQSNKNTVRCWKEYDKGQVIIKEEALLVAKNDFISKSSFDSNNWEKYTKHDYAIFNPIHTWVEYINRLLGALAGIACIITFILSFGYRKENKN
jgi:cytochrome c oxidase assembly protein subunit 15